MWKRIEISAITKFHKDVHILWVDYVRDIRNPTDFDACRSNKGGGMGRGELNPPIGFHALIIEGIALGC